MRKLLKTPITYDQIKDLRIGDTVYLSGELVTCRDAGHRCVLREGIMPETVSLRDGAIFHAGPIVGKDEDGKEKSEFDYDDKVVEGTIGINLMLISKLSKPSF